MPAIMHYYRIGTEKTFPKWVHDACKSSKIVPTIDGLDVQTLEGAIHGKPASWFINGETH